MSSNTSLAPMALVLASAITLVALVTIAPGTVLANDKPATVPTPGANCSCPNAEPDRPRAVRPKFADARPALDHHDEVATLEAIQLALTEVGDGAAYVWHRRHGRLSGVVKPTSSFRDAAGKICRHIVLALSTEGYSRTAEGVACRLHTGVWQLEG